MISERKLVSSHSSFWRYAMPMADAYVRQINRTLTRVVPPCESAFKGIRNSLISEFSFRLYTYCCNDFSILDKLLADTAKVQEIVDEVLRYISRLERFESFLLNMDQLEIAEAKSLTINLRNIRAYTNPGKSVQTRPRFSRCGIVDNCE